MWKKKDNYDDRAIYHCHGPNYPAPLFSSYVTKFENEKEEVSNGSGKNGKRFISRQQITN